MAATSPLVNQEREDRRPSVAARRRPRPRALLLDLLTYAAAELESNPAQAIPPWRLKEVTDSQIQWVVDAGLAPLLYSATRASIDQAPAARRDALRSADLTAQVRHGNLIDATNEIIDACRDMQLRVTLLKGISISDQHYPAAHLRPMGDVDILIPAHAVEAVESAVLQLGYIRNLDRELGEDAHHGAPLFHPGRRVWVEIHTDLFRKRASLRSNRVFSRSHVAAHSVASTFHGRSVDRLTDERQLVYIASSWMKDLSQHDMNPSFVPPSLDAVYLMKASQHSLDWHSLFGWLDNETAIASLYVMLVYLSRCGLHQFAPSILSRLASSQDLVGAAELRVIHALLDHYLIGGKPSTRWFSDWHATITLNTMLAPGSHAAKLLALPWNVVFPPPIPDRYSMRYQLGRIARLLRGSA
jgi:hypothetical protein